MPNNQAVKPSWVDIFVRDFTTVDYSGADEFLHITGAYENIIKFIRQTIAEERAEAVRDVIEALPGELGFTGDLEVDAHANGFNQCRAEIKEKLKKS